MSVNKRGRGWQVSVKHAGERWRVTLPSELVAQAVEKEIKARIDRGQPVDLPAILEATQGLAGERTLGRALSITYARHWRGKKAEEALHRNGKQVVEFFGSNVECDELTTHDVDRLVEHCEKLGLSDATINRKLAALSKIMSVAMVRQMRSTKLIIERRKESQGRIRFLTVEEEDRVIKTSLHFGYTEEADLWACLVDTGGRIGTEMLRVEWRDVDLVRATLTFWDTKNSESRTIPLTPRVKDILAERKKHLGNQRPFPLEYQKCIDVWNRIRAHIGMTEDDQFVIHALRHTCASRMAQAGVPLQVIKEFMGHKSITVTLRYAHLCPSNLLAGVAALASARVAEQVDASALKAEPVTGEGSNPSAGTNVVHLRKPA